VFEKLTMKVGKAEFRPINFWERANPGCPGFDFSIDLKSFSLIDYDLFKSLNSYSCITQTPFPLKGN